MSKFVNKIYFKITIFFRSSKYTWNCFQAVAEIFDPKDLWWWNIFGGRIYKRAVQVEERKERRKEKRGDGGAPGSSGKARNLEKPDRMRVVWRERLGRPHNRLLQQYSNPFSGITRAHIPLSRFSATQLLATACIAPPPVHHAPTAPPQSPAWCDMESPPSPPPRSRPNIH